jgi:hypothetical protein
MAAGALSTKALGSIVKIKESGVLQDFYVTRHDAYTAGRTLLVRRYIYDIRQWHTSNVNAYASSAIDSWLTDTYLGLIAVDIQAQIADVTIPYTPGNDSTTVSDLSRKVFLLSLTELGRSSTNTNVEGTVLNIAGTLRIATNSAGTAQGQWTRTPSTATTIGVLGLSTSGTSYGYTCTSTAGARPAFTLPSNLMVDDNDCVRLNIPPEVNYSGSTALGDQTADFTVQYSVSDADGDTVTVTEKLDGVTKRTYTPTLEANQQVQAVLPANFQTVLNGAHTMTIEATDGKEPATPVTITFTKTVYSCSITLSAPLSADDMPTAIRLLISGTIPGDAVWTVEVCNNGNDASPTWENIKPSIQGVFIYPFTNKTKTAANWGVNFRVSFSRGGSNPGGNIVAIEGGFQ